VEGPSFDFFFCERRWVIFFIDVVEVCCHALDGRVVERNSSEAHDVAKAAVSFVPVDGYVLFRAPY
jgi:hypothetical protein